jgi:hypothetical protein
MTPTARHAGLIVALACGLAASAARAGELRTLQTKYYVIHSDLDPQGTREAELRLTLMAEEYARRLEGLAGAVRQRLPFFLYNDLEDYYAAGGMPGSVGVFTRDRLMAASHPKNPDMLWPTVQHEGFHQFVLAAVGERIPIWANEGLAEYFSHGIFCGDRFLVGFVPQARLQRVRDGIREKQFKPLAEMLVLAHSEWNQELHGGNYDQAWSMVHFLAHAEKGRYQQAFISYLRDMSRGQDAQRTWNKHFGDNNRAFQERWAEYWLALPDNPTADLYAEAVASIVTSFHARARLARQEFETIDEFFAAAKGRTLKQNTDDWLPPRLIESAAEAAPRFGTWSLSGKGAQRIVVLEMADGTTLEGHHKIRGSSVASIEIRERRRR